MAGAAGLLLARVLLDALVGLSPFHLPVSGTIRVDFAVVSFAFATCALAAVAAGSSGDPRGTTAGGPGRRRRYAHVRWARSQKFSAR